MNKKVVLTMAVGMVAAVGWLSLVTSQSDMASDGLDIARLETSYSSAVFAGGCFWCTEADFEKVEGVVEAVSGYAGGTVDNPTYEQVSRGNTGHYEAVKVFYDPAQVNYQQLLDAFWRMHDPSDAGGSFVDRGQQYSSAIFYADAMQQTLAEGAKEALNQAQKFQQPIATAILPLTGFFSAEEYHQNYYKTHSKRYHFYRAASGRPQFLAQTWENDDTVYQLPETLEKLATNQAQEVMLPAAEAMNESMAEAEMDDITEVSEQMSSPVDFENYQRPSDDILRERLTAIQYKVTQRNGTERAFSNQYWDNKEDGIYVDVVSGEPLFSSLDKYDSGTGWPSFSRPIEPDVVSEHDDFKLFVKRTEIRSIYADSHLGHVFEESSSPSGRRYCMNSAALRFVPKDELVAQGYENYLELFQ